MTKITALIICHPVHWFPIRTRTAQQGIMGPFNLAWKTRVILVGGLLPTSTLSSHIPTLRYMCLSTNPPIVIHPRRRHSSWVLAAKGDVFTLDSHRNREDLTGKKHKLTSWPACSQHTAAAVAATQSAHSQRNTIMLRHLHSYAGLNPARIVFAWHNAPTVVKVPTIVGTYFSFSVQLW